MSVKLTYSIARIGPCNFWAIPMCGNTQQHIQQYQKEKVHLVPTPHNTNKVVITDDLPAPILGAWQQALYYVDRHRYLVEID